MSWPLRNLWLVLLIAQLMARGCAQLACRPQEYQLTSTRQLLNITSPNYPQAYAPGSSCRYRVTAPPDHVVMLSCQFDVRPNACGSEYFFISRDGDFQLRDAEITCQTRLLQRSSHFRSISFGYQSRAGAGWRGRFFCQAYARPQRCSCGWSLATRITNGQEALRNEFPSMVALRDVTATQRLFCGGNIVTHRHILTAAHCMAAQPDVGKIVAYVGDHDLTISGEGPFEAQYRIRQAIVHPGYAPSDPSVANDLALLVTQTSIEWSRGVGPICLPFRQAQETFAYANVELAGWGTLSFAGSKSNTLQKIELLVMDNGICRQQYNGTILSSQLCTYDYRGRGQDSCQYDSGGPVIMRQASGQQLLGVISYGRVCGMRHGIGVNTRITAHLNWLWSHVATAVCIA